MSTTTPTSTADPGRRRWRAAALLAFSVVLSGCGPYLFRQSDLVKVTYPAIYSSVKEPLTIQWHVNGTGAADGTRFAVFLDRDPMPPGEGIDYFDSRDREGIWLLDRTTLHLDVLSRRPGVDPAEQDHHDVTVVLLDRAGKRVGEDAGFSEFNIRH